MGLLHFFSRLFVTRAPAPPPTRKTPQLRVIPGGASADPFDQLLAMTGVAAPGPEAPLTQGQEDDVAELSEQVRAHFAANRPAPTAGQSVSLQVLNHVAQGKLSLAELTRLVQRDAALTVGVLKVANSPAYRGAQEIESLRDAVTRLGAEEVGRVAGTFAARTLFQPQLRAEQRWLQGHFNRCHADAMATARVAGALAQRVSGARQDLAWLAGLLHDLGRPVALRSISGLMAGRGHLPQWLVERALDRVHLEVGGEVHQQWDLPRFATLAAVRHHDTDLPDDGEYRDLHVVRLVSALVLLHRRGAVLAQTKAEVDSSARALKLDPFALRSLDTAVTEALASLGEGRPRSSQAG